ncbi:putative rna interference and silencing protein [Phaeomoniella chlamydospora]|uniref:Putative rna interference and silencing protein n=1 Tax=Phaeomoniella chlamydospora TaxID=158046 RepID=A0A0G2GU01_PHACM|nr:putative rna interference and silencing protein [Phaeomoniella chlamydospora]
MSGNDRGGGRRGGGNRGDGTRGSGGMGRGNRGGSDRGYDSRGGGYRGRSDRGRGGGRDRGDRGGRGRGGHGDETPRPGEELYLGINGRGPPSLDLNVATTEEETQRAIRNGSFSTSDIFPLRPSFCLGDGGGGGGGHGALVLWANYFKVKLESKAFFVYEVQILPSTSLKLRTLLIKQMLKVPHFRALGHTVATDYASNLVTTAALKETIIGGISLSSHEGNADRLSYNIQLTKKGEFDTQEFIQYLSSTTTMVDYLQKAEMIQALNIIVGHHPKSDEEVYNDGHNQYFTERGDNIDLGGGVFAVRGCFTSVRPATSRCLVNVQLKHLAVVAPQSQALTEVMNSWRAYRNRGNDMAGLSNFLKGLRVKLSHLQQQPKGDAITKVLQGLANPADRHNRGPHPPLVTGRVASAVSFWWDEKQGYVTVQEYYKTKYNTVIATESLVVKTLKGDQTCYFPEEVCIVVPQTYKRRILGEQSSNMIKFALRYPSRTAKSITQDSLKIVGFRPNNETIKGFGLHVDNEMITVPARILNSPLLTYGRGRTETKHGGWIINKSTRFVEGITLRDNEWGILQIQTHSGAPQWLTEQQMQDCVIKPFQDCLRYRGVTCGSPTYQDPITIEDQQIKLERSFRKLVTDKVKLALVILQDSDTSTYNMVKSLADLQQGVGLHTICILSSVKYKKENQIIQYFTNLSLKVNLKLGGVNHTLSIEKLGIIHGNKTMVVGIDVTHPSPGSKTKATKRDNVVAPSIAGMVASIDDQLAQWPASIKIQSPRQEMVQELTEMLKRHLNLWKERHRELPHNILVYRDGVSEGQYQHVLDTELPQLRTACVDLYPSTSTKANLPRISIIVVGKRHNTRFFPTELDENRVDMRSFNPVSGTVVERGVTEARKWEFFMQSHTALKGTARPAHYIVIHDEIFRKLCPDPATAVQELTYNLCYTFGRAAKAISVVPPARYADLVCDRARRYLGSLMEKDQDWDDENSSPAGEGGGPPPNHPSGDAAIAGPSNSKKSGLTGKGSRSSTPKADSRGLSTSSWASIASGSRKPSPAAPSSTPSKQQSSSSRPSAKPTNPPKPTDSNKKPRLDKGKGKETTPSQPFLPAKPIAPVRSSTSDKPVHEGGSLFGSMKKSESETTPILPPDPNPNPLRRSGTEPHVDEQLPDEAAIRIHRSLLHSMFYI